MESFYLSGLISFQPLLEFVELNEELYQVEITKLVRKKKKSMKLTQIL
jgi:hypothetical protein